MGLPPLPDAVECRVAGCTEDHAVASPLMVETVLTVDDLAWVANKRAEQAAQPQEPPAKQDLHASFVTEGTARHLLARIHELEALLALKEKELTDKEVECKEQLKLAGIQVETAISQANFDHSELTRNKLETLNIRTKWDLMVDEKNAAVASAEHYKEKAQKYKQRLHDWNDDAARNAEEQEMKDDACVKEKEQLRKQIQAALEDNERLKEAAQLVRWSFSDVEGKYNNYVRQHQHERLDVDKYKNEAAEAKRARAAANTTINELALKNAALSLKLAKICAALQD